jgi:hypothetical protein
MFLRFAGVKSGQRRYNPELVKRLENSVISATCLSELFLSMNSLYGLPLKQVAESRTIDGKRRLSWVDKTKLYKVELALSDDGTWFALGKLLNLNTVLSSNLTALFENLRSNETYLFNNDIEPLFITTREYLDISGHFIRGLTISKIRSLPNASKYILNNKHHYIQRYVG